MPRKWSRVWQPKHYEGRQKKKFVPIQIGEKFHRLTVIEIQPQKNGSATVIVCRCECGHEVKTHSQNLRKGYMTGCAADMALERKYAREIEAAKEVERQMSPHVVDSSELPKRESWTYAGDEAALIAEAEKQDAAT